MKRSAVIFLHLGYWLLYLILVAFFVQVMPNTHHHFGRTLFFSQVSLFAFLPALLCFYSFYLVLFPRFLQRKRFLSLFVVAIVLIFCSSLFALQAIAVLFAVKWYALEPSSMAGLILFTAMLGLVHGTIALVMRGFITWFGDIKFNEELNKKNYEMELALVRSQMNPHFLFNTIHNIDVLIGKDPQKASAYLNTLSDMMRFMLYETRADQILLFTELAYIEKYIALQKLRSANPDYVSYHVDGTVAGQMIAPMLFIPFIENAFKHGENKKKENAIHIRFALDEHTIDFYCENKFADGTHSQSPYSGLGNDLIKKRLELLYPGNHRLDVSPANGTYRVHLIIFLP